MNAGTLFAQVIDRLLCKSSHYRGSASAPVRRLREGFTAPELLQISPVISAVGQVCDQH
jgi:hypothetical protein